MRNRSRGAPQGSDPPNIVSVALNDLLYDDRVMRIASTLATHGARVTALGVSSERKGWEKSMGETRVRVIGVPFVRFGLAPWVVITGVIMRLSSLLRRGQPGAMRRQLLRRLSSVLERLERFSVRLGERARGRRWRTAHARLSKELTALNPSAIHANDAEGLAAAVTARRSLDDGPVIVYDAHEWTAGRDTYTVPPPGVPSELELEQEFIGEADAVVTVTGRIAEMLQSRYQLPSAPGVLHNAPLLSWREIEAPSLRDLAQAPDGCPLLVYVGGIAPIRGILDVVAALPLLPPEVRFAALGMGTAASKEEVRQVAAGHGVSERVHLVDPVRPEQIVPTIRDATLGLMPFRRNPNYDLAMPNKLFQYLHAGLPMVVSDCRAVAEFVHEHDLGEVFTAEDPSALADAVGRALGRIDELRDRAGDPELRREFSWEAQERAVLSVYRRLGVLSPNRQSGRPDSALSH